MQSDIKFQKANAEGLIREFKSAREYLAELLDNSGSIESTEIANADQNVAGLFENLIAFVPQSKECRRAHMSFFLEELMDMNSDCSLAQKMLKSLKDNLI